jgi:hypothetical protein
MFRDSGINRFQVSGVRFQFGSRNTECGKKKNGERNIGIKELKKENWIYSFNS